MKKRYIILLGLVICLSACTPIADNNTQPIIINHTHKSTKEIAVEKYYYNSLDSIKTREWYERIEKALVNREEELFIPGMDADTLKFIYRCIGLDNPDFFYVESTYSYELDEEGITLYPKYNMTQNEQLQAVKEIEIYKEKVFSLFTDDMDAYEKEKVIYDYIASNTKYLMSSEYNQTIYSVVKGESVCLGYSKMFQFLCQQIDIPCTIITGTNREGVRHAWNCVYIEGNWYMVDCTNSVGQLTDTRETVSYYFFNITKEQLLRSYSIDNIVESPDCISVGQEYFYKNGFYYDTADIKKYKEQLIEKMNNGEDTLTIRCSNEEILGSLYGVLIEQKEIFNILNSDYQISYVRSNEFLVLQISWKEKEISRYEKHQDY